VNVLLLDTDCTGLDIAYRAAEAGHAVRWYIAPHKDHSKIFDGDGFVGIEKVTSWKPHMAWAKRGIIINLFNDKKLTRELEAWRSFGMPIFGPSARSAELEWNRGKGMKFMQKHGIDVPEYTTFQTLEEAFAFAWKATRPYCFKTMGDEEDKSLSYVASDPADLVGWLEKKIDDGLKLKGPCMLQEKIDMLCEVGISAWMGKRGFLPGKFNVNFEFKKLMPGDYGPNTGEMGTVCKYVEGGRLAEEMLLPFEEDLVKLGHIGDFDIGLGIDTKGNPRPFEFTARFGWPSTQILFACHDGDPVEWMRAAATTGEDLLEVDNRVAIGLVMARPPFPQKNDDPKSSVGYPIEGIEDVWGHVAPWQMMLGRGPVMDGGKLTKGDVYKTTGEYICVVTTQGPDVHDVVADVKETVDRIKFADRIVRIDVGADLERKLPKLAPFGYDELPKW
jgi:phosphoribosylamine---glycine ligase